MKEHLRICGVQFDIAWEQPEANYQRIATLLEDAVSPDVIVLPEMFTTGFSMAPERIAEGYSEEMATITFMHGLAQRFGALVMGSVAVNDQGQYFNRLLCVYPDRTIVRYDKNHLFTFGNEHCHYTSGKEAVIIEWQGWKIKPLICYDLRFPELARNRWEEERAAYDVLVYVANWPAVRSFPWSTLLRARAIENQCYLAGINRVGDDGNQVTHSGDSAILDARGGTLSELKPGESGLLEAAISAQALLDFRTAFPVLRDCRSEE